MPGRAYTSLSCHRWVLRFWVLLGFDAGDKLLRISHRVARLSFFVFPDFCIDVAVKETVRRAWYPTAKMAQSNWQKLKNRWNAETKDEEKLAAHLRLLRAVGLFAGSVFLMRNFGDLMAI